MRIPAQQKIEYEGGGTKKFAVNSDYTYTQITVANRNTGSVKAYYRPILESNFEADFLDAEFEEITGGDIDLTKVNGQRTFTIESKRASAIMMVDTGAGPIDYLVLQWGRAF